MSRIARVVSVWTGECVGFVMGFSVGGWHSSRHAKPTVLALCVLTKAIHGRSISSVDTEHVRDGIAFVWDEDKAVANRAKHGISFDRAIEAFFDPFVRVVDAGVEDESRDALIGMDESFRLLFVVHLELEDEAYRIVSARRATAQERRTYET